MEEKINFVGKCLLIENAKRKEKSLVVGDLHIGYEEYLNRAGVYVSRKMFKEMILEFEEIFKKVGKVNKIILLGDIKHEFGEIVKQEWSEILKLFDYLEKKSKEMIVLKGNHDGVLEPIADKKGLVIKDFLVWDEFCFLHGDKNFVAIYDKKIKYWIIGHGHPAVKLSDGIKIEKYKCFLIGKFDGKKVIIVPSFFGYFEGTDPRESNLGLAWNFEINKFEARVVGENLEVLSFGELGKIK